MWPFSRGFPYSNLHDLNLDWIINKIKELENAIDVNADTGKIDKSIKNGDTETYKFVVDSEGIAMEDPNTGIKNPLIKWSDKSVNAAIAAFMYYVGYTYKARSKYTFVTGANDDEIAVIEMKPDRHIQIWTKSENGQPEHYSLPVPDSATPQFYNILTSKIQPTVTNDVITTYVSSGGITLYKYLNIVTIKVSVILAGIPSGYYADIFEIPVEYRPSTSLFFRDCADPTTKYIELNSSGKGRIYYTTTPTGFQGNMTYIVE